jgi:hypothetical protein
MSDHLLNEAARALREDELESSETPSVRQPWRAMDGWSEIVQEVRRGRRRRRLALMATLQIGLVLAGFGAWATATGRLPIPFAPRPQAEPTRAAPARSARASRPATEAVPTEPPATEQVVPEPATAVQPSTAPRIAPPRRLRAPAARAIAPRAEAPADPEVVYGEAHDAHFVRHDYEAALAAWDRYLALPSAALAVEARYNRALALVRLQRRAEAVDALEPFAAGHYGGYRREEARALLSALRSPQP